MALGDANVYVEHSALMHAGGVKTPTSLVHGLTDERVPVRRVVLQLLKRVSVPTDLLLLPRQLHTPAEPRCCGRRCNNFYGSQIHLDAAPAAAQSHRPAPGGAVMRHPVRRFFACKAGQARDFKAIYHDSRHDHVAGA